MALNLGVTSCQSLEISLDQFVRGEVLEGSNAYYCEKCEEKVLILHFCESRFTCSLIFLSSMWSWKPCFDAAHSCYIEDKRLNACNSGKLKI